MRRSWLAVAAVVGIAVVVIVVVLVRAADDDSGRVETGDWASSVCSSFSDWRSTLAALVDVSAGEATPEMLRESLADASEATEELISELRELGPPDVESADEVERALDDATAGLEESYEALRLEAEDAASATSPTEFVQELAGLADDLQLLLARAAETVAVLQSASLFGDASDELEEAFAEADSCQELQEEGS